MYYNEITQTAKTPKIWASIAPFINPATIVPIAAIGTICLTSIFVINKLKSENKRLSADKALNNRTLTANPTVTQPLNEPLPTVETNGIAAVESYKEKPPYSEPTISDDEIKKEMIRQTMSELGKRSAKARAKNKERNLIT